MRDLYNRLLTHLLLLVLVSPTTCFSASSHDLESFGIALVHIPAGELYMGDSEGDDNEAPKIVKVKSFRIMRDEVTNAQFRKFVNDTNYVTDVERAGHGYVWTDRWRTIDGLSWRNPHSKADDISQRSNHPVVQVSAHDAEKYCVWLGLRLPSEAEWEYAARGGDRRQYPWGNEQPRNGSTHRANFGTIPCCAADTQDGYQRTAPVGKFPLGDSAFGIKDMAGNVWEWTSTSFPGRPKHMVLRGGGWGNNPYCLRVSYRHGNPPNIGLNMVGIRCAADREE